VKKYIIDTELARHAHKLDVKLQSWCGSVFSLLALRMLAKPYHLGANWPTTQRKQRCGTFLYPQFWMP